MRGRGGMKGRHRQSINRGFNRRESCSGHDRHVYWPASEPQSFTNNAGAADLTCIELNCSLCSVKKTTKCDE